MKNNALIEQTKEHLHILCTEISERRVGSIGNRKATDYLKSKLQKNKWIVEETLLKVMDWKTQGATLSCGHQFFDIFSSPYSLGCSVQGELVPIDNIEKLRESEITDKIVFLYGKIALEQIMPKNFEFYNPEEHKQIIATLEQKKPKAIICATALNSALAGGVYPFPLFEDGDFDIPSVYMKDIEGEKLLTCSKQIDILESKAKRIPETAFNIVARKAKKIKKGLLYQPISMLKLEHQVQLIMQQE